jgi:DNA ligase-1
MQFSSLCGLFRKLENTRGKINKTNAVSTFLKKVKEPELPIVAPLISGKIAPHKKAGVAESTMIAAVAAASKKSREAVVKSYRETGNLGVTAERLLKGKARGGMAVKTLHGKIEELGLITGSGSAEKKVAALKYLLLHNKPADSRFVVELMLNRMSTGVGEHIVVEALAKRHNMPLSKFKAVYKTYGMGAAATSRGSLKGIQPFRPVKPMLAKTGKGAVGERVAYEMKYDGGRIHAHKKGNSVRLYTRNRNEVTSSLPEVVACVRRLRHDVILDGEAVAYNKSTGRAIPFQHVMTRFRRKDRVEETMRQIPVKYKVFDILYLDGKSLVSLPFSERRKVLTRIMSENKDCRMAEQIVTDDQARVKQFFDKSVHEGNEGLMIKYLDAPYQAGTRSSKMLKMKATLDTLDLAIVAAEAGRGKFAGLFRTFVVAAKKGNSYVVLGRVASGFNDKQLREITRKLRPLVTGTKGMISTVRPHVIVEVSFEELQKSTTYESGLAIRHPKLVGIRYDKSTPDNWQRVLNIKGTQSRYV